MPRPRSGRAGCGRIVPSMVVLSPAGFAPRGRGRRAPWVVWVFLAAIALSGCSIKRMAIGSLGNALAGGQSTFAEDDDPDLVGEAVPFALKTTEALLREAPRHRGLRLAVTSGFAQYAYGFIQQQADFVEARDLEQATGLRARARRLYLRGREYGLGGLEIDCPGFAARLRVDATAALACTKRRHVPLLYWTGRAWFGAINLAKDDADLTADQHLAEALMRRALILDEGFAEGALHEFFLAWEARGDAVGGSRARARAHLARALALSQGRRAWPMVTFAESVCVAEQDRKCFEDALNRALAVDPSAEPKYRLNNLIVQRRARWLMGRADELFLE
jgi:predicted anti-sigma-YlaC factor YlaD